MKKHLKIKIIVLVCMSFILAGCTLGLQEEFDFEPDIDLREPFDNLTAWEFIQTQTPPRDSNGGYNNEGLDFMIAAIKKAGFEDLYNQTATKERTYLLLNNGAFEGGGDVIQLATGSSRITVEETADEVMSRVDTPEKLERLRTILRYHIVTTYIAQVPTLEISDVRYIFQTLIPGEDGRIGFHRTDRWYMRINNAPAPLPQSATSQSESVRRHHYVFKNGIGHFINDPVRNKPY